MRSEFTLKKMQVDVSHLFRTSSVITALAWIDSETGLCIVKEGSQPLPFLSDSYYPYYLCLIDDSGVYPCAFICPSSLLRRTGLDFRRGFYTRSEAQYYLKACARVYDEWYALIYGGLKEFSF